MARTALLVMDFQNAIVDRLGSPDVVAAAESAVDAARAHDVPVVFVRVAFRPGYPEVAATNQAFAGAAQRGDSMTEAHPATQVHASPTPRADEPVVVKRRVSAFSGSDLDGRQGLPPPGRGDDGGRLDRDALLTRDRASRRADQLT